MGSRRAPTTTWSSRSRPASCSARVHANIELDRARRTRDALRRSGDLLDQAQRLARVGSWEIDLETERMTASAGVPAPGRADR